MFSREQIDTLYYLIEKGVVTEADVKTFLNKKLVEVGFDVTPPPAPEVPGEPVPPAPEQPVA